MKLSPDHVALPREDYIELTSAAYDQTPATVGERVGSTVQTTAMVLGLSAAVTAGTWGWAKAVDWLEERRLRRTLDEAQKKHDLRTPPKD